MKIKSGVIGCGRAGSLFDIDFDRKNVTSHCGAYSNHPHFQLQSICDEYKPNLSTAIKAWNPNNAYESYKEMIKKESLDIISICTQPESHFEVFNYLVKNGIKNIFCEKPLSNDIDEAAEMVSIANAHKTNLIVNHQKRWNPNLINLKKCLDSKSYGQVQHVVLYYTRGIFNTGSHLFDLVSYLFGKIRAVQSFSSINDFKAENTISGCLELLNGSLVYLVGLNGENYRIFNCEVYTSKGKFLFDSASCVAFFASEVSKRTSEFNELAEKNSFPFKNFDGSEILAALDNIYNYLNHNDTLLSTGETSLQSLHISYALLNSIENNKEKIILQAS